MTTPKWPIKNDLLEKGAFRFYKCKFAKKRRDQEEISKICHFWSKNKPSYSWNLIFLVLSDS